MRTSRQSRQIRRARERRRLASGRPLLADAIPEPARRIILPLLTAVLTAALAVFAWNWRPVPLPQATPVINKLEGYHILYEVTDTAAKDQPPLLGTEIVDIHRPFRSRTDNMKGAPPGEKIQFASVLNDEYSFTLSEGGEEQYGVKRSPGGAQRDGSLAAMNQAAEEGLAKYEGTTTVEGIRCHRFLHHAPYPEVLSPAKSKKERVITCVSDNGLVLREDWWLSGRLVRVRKAIEVSPKPPPPERFFVGRAPAETKARELVAKEQKLEENKVGIEGKPLRPRKLPEGFKLDRAATFTDSGGGQGPPRITYHETFVRGYDLVSIDQGPTSTGNPPWDIKQGRPIPVGRVGDAWVVYFIDHVEIRIAAKNNFARIRAPSLDLALFFARSLRS